MPTATTGIFLGSVSERRLPFGLARVPGPDRSTGSSFYPPVPWSRLTPTTRPRTLQPADSLALSLARSALAPTLSPGARDHHGAPELRAEALAAWLQQHDLCLSLCPTAPASPSSASRRSP